MAGAGGGDGGGDAGGGVAVYEGDVGENGPL